MNPGFFGVNSNNLYINHEQQQNLNQLHDYYGNMQQNSFLANRLNSDLDVSGDSQLQNTSTPTSVSPMQTCIGSDKLLIHDSKPISSAVFERNNSDNSNCTNGSATLKSSSSSRFRKCTIFITFS